ncbi:MAG: ferredoxin family protein [Planctomycetota bacterium]
MVGALLGERGIDVAVTPHLYDLKPDSPELVGLQSLASDLVVCSWLYPRAARWTLDRHQVRGGEGKTLIPAYGEDDEVDEGDGVGTDGDEGDDDTTVEDGKLRVIDSRPTPKRSIYCLDLRTHAVADPYIAEVKRIAAEGAVQTVTLGGYGGGLDINSPAKAEGGGGKSEETASEPAPPPSPLPLPPSEAAPARRWYPVIDYSRCTNCMECIDFCLFGVYGLDVQETLLVEQPDNCRKGCPACSRVCPENAIIFPQHKTPTIAGSPEVGGPMKIDLSKLFGAPDPGAPGAAKAVDVAVLERDAALVDAGRDTVGKEVGLEKRQSREAEERPKDDLDELIDQLDAIKL